jgi:hypothetical protein
MHPPPKVGLSFLAVDKPEECGQRVVNPNFILGQRADGIGIGHGPAHRRMSLRLPHREEVIGSGAQWLRGANKVRLMTGNIS